MRVHSLGLWLPRIAPYEIEHEHRHRQTRFVDARPARAERVVTGGEFGFTAGLLQAAVNQGDHWLRHEVGAGVVVKTIVSPLIGLTLVLFTSAATWVQKTLEHQKA